MFFSPSFFFCRYTQRVFWSPPITNTENKCVFLLAKKEQEETFMKDITRKEAADQNSNFKCFFLSPSCLSSPRFIGIFHLCWTMLSTGPCSLILCDFFFFFAPMRYYISYLLDPFFFLFMELVDDVRECGGGQTLYAGDFIGPSPLLVLRRMCCV